MTAKKAIISGITGQDGSYLAEFLLNKNYEVYGLQRRASIPNTERIDHLYSNAERPNFFMVYADLTDADNLNRIIQKVKPDEIYNLGAQSHVGVSFDVPEYTMNVNAMGALHLLEAIRNQNFPVRFYQASSSEMFGKVLATPQDETTPFNPQSPYGLSKVCAFYLTRMYRAGFGVFASNGILFNHESPRRGLNFVTRKITLGLARIKLGLKTTLRLGNLNAVRDWGFSKDYVEAIWAILQYHQADDFVIATGETHTVREFVEEVGRFHGLDIVWEGEGLNEKGIDRKTKATIIEVDPIFFRPNEVELLKGNASKAKRLLNWQPKTTFKELARLMANSDLKYAEQEALLGKPIVSQRRFAV